MKLSYSLLLIFSLAISLVACKGENYNKDLKKKRAANSKKKKKAPKAKKATTADFYASAKKAVGLSDKQVASLKKSNKVHEAKIGALKKAKKWDGAKNESTRKKMTSTRQAEMKKIVGAKYAKYMAFLKQWNNKKPKKKKAPAKKKPARKK